MRPVSWTAERLDAACDLIASGLNYRLAADRMGVTKGSLIGAVWRMKGADVPLKFPEHWFVGGCRWVIGDPKIEWHWCGKECVLGRSWCAEHMRAGFQVLTPSAKKYLDRLTRL